MDCGGANGVANGGEISDERRQGEDCCPVRLESVGNVVNRRIRWLQSAPPSVAGKVRQASGDLICAIRLHVTVR